MIIKRIKFESASKMVFNKSNHIILYKYVKTHNIGKRTIPKTMFM